MIINIRTTVFLAKKTTKKTVPLSTWTYQTDLTLPCWTQFYLIQTFLIQTYPIQTYPIQTYPIQTYPIQTYPIQTYPIQTCPIQTYPIKTYLIRTYLIQDYPTQTYSMKLPNCTKSILILPFRPRYLVYLKPLLDRFSKQIYYYSL